MVPQCTVSTVGRTVETPREIVVFLFFFYFFSPFLSLDSNRIFISGLSYSCESLCKFKTCAKCSDSSNDIYTHTHTTVPVCECVCVSVIVLGFVAKF